MGPTASVLVTNGTLSIGDSMICGKYWGRVKALINDKGIKVRSASPSMAVKVLGLVNVPGAGDYFEVLENEKEAKKMIQKLSRSNQKQNNKITTLSQVVKRAKASKENEINVVIKTGSNGALTAVEQVVGDLTSEDIQVKIISGSVGAVTDSDVMLASSAEDCIIVAFQTIVQDSARSHSEANNIPIRSFDIIYTLVDEIKEIIQGLKGEEKSEINIGSARILEVFPRGKVQKIAGVRVTDGKILRNK